MFIMTPSIVTFFTFLLASCVSGFATGVGVHSEAVASLGARRIQLRKNLDELASARNSDTFWFSHDVEAECLDFLVTNMPARDVEDPKVSAEFLLRQTRVALAARNATHWAFNVPW